MNSFGSKYVFTSFGESHGRAVGGVLDGVPAGLHIDLEMIRHELDRRAGRSGRETTASSSVTGASSVAGVSSRAQHEADEVEWLSGVLDGVTLGTPVAFLLRNKDARPEDYEWLRQHYRQGHADRVYEQKYGLRDWRGGGRASARETAARVVAGAIMKQMLRMRGIRIEAELVQVGTETRPDHFAETIAHYQSEGDSIGGIVRCTIHGLPVGTGEPIFDKLQAHLAFAVMSINACKGFDYGSGFAGVAMPGSRANLSNGGIVGGLSDGEDIVFRAVFKPTPSISKWGVRGRHDACVAVRAVPVVEAMAALALANLLD